MRELTDITITKFNTDLKGRYNKVFYIALRFNNLSVTLRFRVGFTLSEVLLVLISAAHAIATSKDGDSLTIGDDESLEAVLHDTEI